MKEGTTEPMRRNVYESMIQMHSVKLDYKRVEELVNEMIQIGIKPETKTCRIVLSMWIRLRNIQMVNSILNFMFENGILITDQVYEDLKTYFMKRSLNRSLGRLQSMRAKQQQQLLASSSSSTLPPSPPTSSLHTPRAVKELRDTSGDGSSGSVSSSSGGADTLSSESSPELQQQQILQQLQQHFKQQLQQQQQQQRQRRQRKRTSATTSTSTRGDDSRDNSRNKR